MDTRKTYVLIHFWPTAGGFKKRMDMLLKVLAKRCPVTKVQTFGTFLRFLWKAEK